MVEPSIDRPFHMSAVSGGVGGERLLYQSISILTGLKMVHY